MPLCGASMAIYAAGIALNDVFDYEVDLRERPNRPLPSRRVSLGFARGMGSMLLLFGPMLALLSGVLPAIVATILAACVLLYDAGLKRTFLGPEVMGTCRGLNLLLGLSAASRFGGPPAWIAAGGLAAFVMGLTWISRSETESGRSRGLIAGTVIQDLAIVALLWVATSARQFPSSSDRPILPAEGLLVLGLVALVVNLADGKAIIDPVPKTIQKAVKTGVLSLVWLDVGLVAAVRGPARPGPSRSSGCPRSCWGNGSIRREPYSCRTAFTASILVACRAG